MMIIKLSWCGLVSWGNTRFFYAQLELKQIFQLYTNTNKGVHTNEVKKNSNNIHNNIQGHAAQMPACLINIYIYILTSESPFLCVKSDKQILQSLQYKQQK